MQINEILIKIDELTDKIIILSKKIDEIIAYINS